MWLWRSDGWRRGFLFAFLEGLIYFLAPFWGPWIRQFTSFLGLPALFAATVLAGDLIAYLFWRVRNWLYLDDLARRLILFGALGLFALGAAWLAEYYIGGEVEPAFLAPVAYTLLWRPEQEGSA
ncbi:MAG: hypothetical protein HYY09_05810 [Firmicutes bacterium]|nr:hypothetical protein [Bacillota bacterium]